MKTSFITATKILLPFCAILLPFFLNYSGFCFRELRYLSSQEKIESLFNIWNRSSLNKWIFIDGEYKVLKRNKRYANFDEFLAKHPNCCQIDPDGGYDTGPPNFFDRILGYDSGTRILLKFNEEFIDEDGNILTEEIEIVDRLQNCGESFW